MHCKSRRRFLTQVFRRSLRRIWEAREVCNGIYPCFAGAICHLDKTEQKPNFSGFRRAGTAVLPVQSVRPEVAPTVEVLRLCQTNLLKYYKERTL